LRRWYEHGDQPEFYRSGPNSDAGDAVAWFGYFHAVSLKDTLAWSAGRYVPTMERTRVIETKRLADTPAFVVR
jgi:hypothetical protein